MQRVHEPVRSRDPFLSSLLKGALSGLLGVGLSLGLLSCGGGGGGGSTPTPTPAADFTLQIPQAQASAAAGTSAQITVFANRTNGHNDAVALSLDVPPAGITASGSIPAGSASGTLNLTTAPTTGPQLYFLNVRGTAGSLTRTVALGLTVTAPADFQLALGSNTALVPVGGSVPVNVAVTRVNGHAEPITLSVEGLPAGLSASGTIAGSSTTGQLTLQSSGAAYPFALNLTVKGTAGSLVRSATNALTVTVVPATQGTLSHVAGMLGTPGCLDGPVAQARFDSPSGITSDPAGNVFVADYMTHVIRKILPDGQVRVFAGKPGAMGSVDGPAGVGLLNYPRELAVDLAGNVFFSQDHTPHSISKATPQGTLTTVAGRADAEGYLDGSSTQARFRTPRGRVMDGQGNLFVADSGNHCIRKIAPDGTVTTWAGVGGQAGAVDGTGAAARFRNPWDLALDPQGNLWVCDNGNHILRRITPSGQVSTLAGLAGQSGNVDGVGAAARFQNPERLTPSMDGGMYVGCPGQVIRHVTSEGTVTTLAGVPGQTGYVDGQGTNARFNGISGLARLSNGDLVLSDYNNHVIRRMTASGLVSTWAGLGGSAGYADGPGNNARFDYPNGLAVDAAGVIYVGGQGATTLRRIQPSGVTDTLAGQDGQHGNVDGQGSLARFSGTAGVAVDAASGWIYVADRNNSTIRRVSLTGQVTTLAGTPGQYGHTDGPGATAKFEAPSALCTDATGQIYVADTHNHAIRKVTPAGIVSTLAGAPGTAGSADGPATQATFNSPFGVAADFAGNVYVADSWNHTIRKISLGGTVTTLAGVAGQSGAVDGLGSVARFSDPRGLAIDAAGNLYVADTGNWLIRRISPSGQVTTIAGIPGIGSTVPGALPASVYRPIGVALGPGGEIYISTGDAIVKLSYTLPGVNVAISPTTATLQAGGTRTFSATVTGTANTAVVWSVVEGASGGTITSGGLYTAPVTAGIYHVQATSVADSSRSATTTVTVEAGGQSVAFVGDVSGTGTAGFANGSGAAARFEDPWGISADGAGNLYVADWANQIVRKVTPSGVVNTHAGIPDVPGSQDGSAATARFNSLSAVASDAAGNVYVADFGNHVIRKISTMGQVTTLAGVAGQAGSADGTGTNARFNRPFFLVVDGSGTLYVSDSDNHTIRKITPGGQVSTLAGYPGSKGYVNGTGSVARFDTPSGLALDTSGNLYVAESHNCSIRRITPSGVVTTIAGSPGPGYADGPAGEAKFRYPNGIVFDGSGNLFVADTSNQRIRKITPGGAVLTVAGDGTDETMLGSLPGKLRQPKGLAIVGNALFVSLPHGLVKLEGLLGGTTPSGPATPPYRFEEDALFTSPSTGAKVKVLGSNNVEVPGAQVTFHVTPWGGGHPAGTGVQVAADGTVTQFGAFGNDRWCWIVKATVDGTPVLERVLVVTHNTEKDRQVFKSANWRLILPREWIDQSLQRMPDFASYLDAGWLAQRNLMGLSWSEAQAYALPNNQPVEFDGMMENPDACAFSSIPISIARGCYFYPDGNPRWFIYFHELGHIMSMAQQSRAAFAQIYDPGSTFIEGDASLLAMMSMRAIMDAPATTPAAKQIIQVQWDQETNYWLGDLLNWENQSTAYSDNNSTFNANMWDAIHLRFAAQYGWSYVQRYVRAWRNDPHVLSLLGIPWGSGLKTTATQRATFAAAAMSAAVQVDERARFKAWRFPVDDALFDQLYPYLRTAMGQSWDVGPISVVPAALRIRVGQSQQFSAILNGPASVQWSIPEGEAGGTITANGLYTAPVRTGVFHVVAKNPANASQYFKVPILVIE